jgi:hypothetical protein
MRVVATRDFRTYHRMVSVRVSKGQTFEGDFAEFLAAGNCPVKVLGDGDGGDVVDAESDERPPAGAETGTDQGDGPAAQAPGDGEQGGGREEEPAPDVLDITGTAAQVLEWVGDDPDRARAAHEAESEKDKPRSTLLRKLEEIAGG